MSGRVLPFDGSEHAAADVLLPFYVNDTLTGEERTFVERHLAACEICRGEAEWLKSIYAACAASPMLQDAARALADSRAAPARDAAPVPGATPRRGPVARIRQEWHGARPWTRWLIAAQLAAIALLGAFVATQTRDEAEYRTLGAGNPSAATRHTVAVMFDPAISAAELRRIVLALDARIVDGPSSMDVFVLEIAPERLAGALSVLRSEPAVRLAEPLGPAARP